MASQPSDQVQPAAGVSFNAALRNCLPTGFLMVDASRRITAINGIAASWLGLESSPHLEHQLDSIPAPQRLAIEQAWGSKDEVTDLTFESPQSSGPSISLQARALRQQGPPAAMLLLLSEAGLARSFHDQITRLDKLVTLGTLSAGLAHELRNALVTTKTFVEVLLEKDRGNELAEIVPREIRHIETLLGQMLRYGAPETVHMRALHLHETLDHSLRLVRHQCRAKDISVHQEYAAAPDLVNGDPDQLQQVFLNLLLNAAEAMSLGGQLTIRTAATPDASTAHAGGARRLLVSIEDTGIGIPQANLGRIFDTFFTTKPEGSGLGLAMSRRILHSHGGEIRVQSRPGEGAIFTVDLPLPPAAG